MISEMELFICDEVTSQNENTSFSNRHGHRKYDEKATDVDTCEILTGQLVTDMTGNNPTATNSRLAERSKCEKPRRYKRDPSIERRRLVKDLGTVEQNIRDCKSNNASMLLTYDQLNDKVLQENIIKTTEKLDYSFNGKLDIQSDVKDLSAGRVLPKQKSLTCEKTNNSNNDIMPSDAIHTRIGRSSAHDVSLDLEKKRPLIASHSRRRQSPAPNGRIKEAASAETGIPSNSNTIKADTEARQNFKTSRKRSPSAKVSKGLVVSGYNSRGNSRSPPISRSSINCVAASGNPQPISKREILQSCVTKSSGQTINANVNVSASNDKQRVLKDILPSTCDATRRSHTKSSIIKSSQLRGYHRSTSPSSRHSQREMAFLQSVRRGLFAQERQKLEESITDTATGVYDNDATINTSVKSNDDKRNLGQGSNTRRHRSYGVSEDIQESHHIQDKEYKHKTSVSCLSADIASPMKTVKGKVTSGSRERTQSSNDIVSDQTSRIGRSYLAHTQKVVHKLESKGNVDVDGTASEPAVDLDILLVSSHRKSIDASSTATLRRRNGSSDRICNADNVSASMSTCGAAMTDADRKLITFRQAEKLGKPVCVCGASAFYERESVRLNKEKSRAKQDSDQLKEHLQKLGKEKQRIATTKMQLSNREAEIETLEKRNQRRAEALQDEMEVVEKNREEMSKLKNRAEEQMEDAGRKEQEAERKLKKLERDQKTVEEDGRRNKEEHQKILDQWLRIKRTQSQIDEEQKKLEKNSTELEKRNKMLEEWDAKIHSQRNELQSMEHEMKIETRRLEKMREELQELEEKNKMELEKANHMNQINLEVEKSLNKKQATLDEAKEEMVKNNIQMEATKAELECLKQEVHELTESEKKRIEQMRLKMYDEMSIEGEKRNKEFEDYMAEQRRQYDILLDNHSEEWQRTTKQFESELKNNRLAAVENDNLRTELNKEQEALAKGFEDLEGQEDSIMQQCENADERQKELDMREVEINKIEVGIRSDKQAASDNTQKLEQLEKKLMREAEAQNAMTEKLALESEFVKRKTEELNERSDALNARENFLTSKEAQTTWIENVYAEATDLKERYELQLSELSWEKKSVENLGENFEAAKRRHMEKIAHRDEILTMKEKELATRENEIKRLEKMVDSRVRNFNAGAGAPGSSNRKIMTIRPSTVSSTSPSPATGRTSDIGLRDRIIGVGKGGMCTVGDTSNMSARSHSIESKTKAVTVRRNTTIGKLQKPAASGTLVRPANSNTLIATTAEGAPSNTKRITDVRSDVDTASNNNFSEVFERSIDVSSSEYEPRRTMSSTNDEGNLITRNISPVKRKCSDEETAKRVNSEISVGCSDVIGGMQTIDCTTDINTEWGNVNPTTTHDRSSNEDETLISEASSNNNSPVASSYNLPIGYYLQREDVDLLQSPIRATSNRSNTSSMLMLRRSLSLSSRSSFADDNEENDITSIDVPNRFVDVPNRFSDIVDCNDVRVQTCGNSVTHNISSTTFCLSDD